MCVCVCVCVRERESKDKIDRKIEGCIHKNDNLLTNTKEGRRCLYGHLLSTLSYYNYPLEKGGNLNNVS